MILDEELKYEQILWQWHTLNLEDLNSELKLLYTSHLPHKEMRTKVYELQLPFLNSVHCNVLSAIIKEAGAMGLLTNGESLESLKESRPDLFFEEFELEDLQHHKVFASVFSHAYKYTNIARLLNLRWIVQLQEVIRTPTSLILAWPVPFVTLAELFEHECDSITTARAILMLANAIIGLQNYGIAHRGIQPCRVHLEEEPHLQLKLSGFDRSASYLDNDTFPKVEPSDYAPADVDWPNCSRSWDHYSLCMIIFEWHMRKLKVIPPKGLNKPLRELTWEKSEI